MYSSKLEAVLAQQGPYNLTEFKVGRVEFHSMLTTGLAILCPDTDVADWRADMRVFRTAAKLSKVHAAPRRHYHTGPHPLEMSYLLRTYTSLIEIHDWEHAVIQLMIAFHDAIYHIPGHSQYSNEVLSARWAEHVLTQLGVPARYVRYVSNGIQASEHHTMVGVECNCHRAVAIFLDLDLWRLGNPWDDFQRDSTLVLKEYEHLPEYTEAAGLAGRAAWARAFLAAEKYKFRYRAPHLSFCDAREAQAADNLRRTANMNA